ncbi:MAG: DODA-type extradiol aromatic ring-opening family dioxygenase, partial [Anaerolineales bacterium]
ILGDAGHKAMVDFMMRLPARLTKPDAILVISAHWEERVVTLLGSPHPPMFYDYYGFPKQAYEVIYPAPGNPEFAQQVARMLADNYIPSQINSQRGFDHGAFIPLMLMYPKADIPTIQLSLIRGLDPRAHIELGKALRGLLSENILVIGSGFSFHNQNAFFNTPIGTPDPANDEFQNWLIETCSGDLNQEEREQRLIEWEKAPQARYCHPREEHLLPLHVCQAMANSRADVVFDDQILGKRGVGFLWK